MTNNFSIVVSDCYPLPVFLCLMVAFSLLPTGAYANQATSAWAVAEEGLAQEAEMDPLGSVPDAVETTTDLEDDSALQEALEASEPKEASRTATIRNRQLAEDIKAQFKAIDELMKRQDAFSQQVGELYYSYASLLLQAAEFEKARDAFAYALHVEKVNHGIYALEQRPALKGLFDTMFAQGKTEEFEEYLNRILWVENQHSDYKDDFTFGLLLKAGNHYIDQFLARPVAGEVQRTLLQKANRYLVFAIQRYGDAPLSEKLMPYGELALANTLEWEVVGRMNRLSAYEFSRTRNDFKKLRDNSPEVPNSFGRGEFFLKKYLIKAQLEKEPADIASALIQLGDLSLMFQRPGAARQYYELAWLEVQNLPADHELRMRLAEPVELPAFNYAQTRKFIPTKRATKLVPITFAVKENGKVADIRPMQKQDENFEYYSKAKSAARRLIFRPAVVDGKMVGVDEVTHEVRVVLKQEERQQNQASSG